MCVCVCVCVCVCACTQVGRLEDEKREVQATHQLYLLTELQREQEVRDRGSWRKGGWVGGGGGGGSRRVCMHVRGQRVLCVVLYP
jgi:hypothetical protein